MKQIGIAGMMMVMLFAAVPSVSFGQQGTEFPSGTSGVIGENPSNPGVVGENPSNPGVVGENPGTINSPLKAKNIIEFLRELIRVVRIFAVPIVVFFIIYAGFLIATSRGNEAQISKGKTALTWAIIGGVIVLGAELILDVIQNTLSEIV